MRWARRQGGVIPPKGKARVTANLGVGFYLAGTRRRFYSVVDLVNRLEANTKTHALK
jgi:hypothetical protein